MKVTFFLISLPFCLSHSGSDVSIRETIILTHQEQLHLREVISQDEDVHSYFVDLQREAQSILEDLPNPLKIIHYEGPLHNNQAQNATQKSLEDMDKVVYELAYYFEPAYKMVLDELTGSPSKKYPSWLSLIIDVARTIR